MIAVIEEDRMLQGSGCRAWLQMSIFIMIILIIITITINMIILIMIIMIIFNIFIRERQDVAWVRLQGMVANEQGRKVSQAE